MASNGGFDVLFVIIYTARGNMEVVGDLTPMWHRRNDINVNEQGKLIKYSIMIAHVLFVISDKVHKNT